MRILIFLFYCVYILPCYGQSNLMNDCKNAHPIINPGTYTFNFSGKAGEISDFSAYPSLVNIEEDNSLWFSFVAPFDGRFSFEAISSKSNLNFIIFESYSFDECEDILSGKAEIKRIISKYNAQNVGLKQAVDVNHLYPLDLLKGTKIMLYIGAEEGGKNDLKLKLSLEALSNEAQSTNENSKIIDKRPSPNSPPLNILVRDAETGAPVIADLVIEGENGITGFYRASDLFLTVSKSGQIKIKCDALGYFFVDRTEPVQNNTEHEFVIWLEPLGVGKSFQLEEIEFLSGTSEFLAGAESKLKRLKEFMVLNPDVKIEIQGHVFAIGENTTAGQKLSEARAKQVCKFLLENGIEKSRLTTVGYGNTKPVYEKPRFEYEEQANRRVEIKVM